LLSTLSQFDVVQSAVRLNGEVNSEKRVRTSETEQQTVPQE